MRRHILSTRLDIAVGPARLIQVCRRKLGSQGLVGTVQVVHVPQRLLRASHRLRLDIRRHSLGCGVSDRGVGCVVVS